MRTRILLAICCLLTASLSARGSALAGLREVGIIPLPNVEGRIDHMAYDAKSGRLYAAALGNDTVEVVDVAQGKVIHVIRGLHEPQGIGIAAAAHRIMVANGKDGSCRIFDDRSFQQVGLVDLKDDADNIRYDAASRRFCVGYGDGGLACIDPETGKQLADVKLDGHPESFQLEARGRRIFVNVPTAHQVAVIDRDRLRIVAKWPVKGAAANFPMALDETDHRLFIGCRSPARLLVLDTQTGKLLASAPIVGDTDDLFYDLKHKCIYVSGGEGKITIVRQETTDRYAVAGELTTIPGARTSFFVPDAGTLYLAVPHRGTQRAELRVFKTEPPGP
ncbi:MAG TPA: PQQ-binding-like beta-propeller repeat protein [Tepidisphaeraceae bacterium]|nr:PQQ-binding-like beta-propeller repeat protein [Tepidisphaeraceae bacterium]